MRTVFLNSICLAELFHLIIDLLDSDNGVDGDEGY